MYKYLCLLIIILTAPLSGVIIETVDLDPFEKALENLDEGSLVLFDVDETLIVPKDVLMRPCGNLLWNRYYHQILKNPTIIPYGKYQEGYLYGQISSRTEYELVDPKVVPLIHGLQKRNIKTIAFTAMRTGAMGKIPSMEDWRIEQLKNHQLYFGQAFPDHPIVELRASQGTSLFKEGVLCSNRNAKGPALTAFLNYLQWTPAKILFIDNRLDFIESVEKALEGTGIEFIGFYYTALEAERRIIDEKVAYFQVMHLAEKGHWLTDEEAAEMLKCASINAPQL